jgi:Tannase and feruloyl esterase
MNPTPTRSRTRLPTAVLLACSAVLAAPLAAAQDDGPAYGYGYGNGNGHGHGNGPRLNCAALAGRTIGSARILTSATVPATSTLDAYCKVSGRIDPQLNFELRLPVRWNRKLHYGGGGGYNGSIPPVVAPALNAGYAQVSSDSGHQGSGLDASFALNDPVAAQLFGSLSVPTVMGAATEIVRRHYGRNASRHYFEGCSNGGREALMNVQRYPTLFDGVIARAPAYNWVGLMGAFNRTAKLLAAPGGRINAGKTATLAAAVRAACDTLDGVADGVVSNPAACSYNPAALRCAGGADTGDGCLSDAQLASVASWTSPASFGGGAYRNPGWPLTGNEDSPGAWDAWTVGAASLQFLFSDTTVKNYLARDPAANSLTYDFDSNLGALFGLAALNDATNANLHPFLGAGGKLILWHGGNDSALTVKATADYHGQVVQAVGGRANADQFMRFYVAPGVNHCAGGPGADSADLLTALDEWVERRRSPGTLLARKVDAATGNTVLSRPLCVYPAYPRYRGQGNVNVATSYTCTAP